MPVPCTLFYTARRHSFACTGPGAIGSSWRPAYMQASQMAWQRPQQTPALCPSSSMQRTSSQHRAFRPILPVAASDKGDAGFANGINDAVQQRLQQLDDEAKQVVAQLEPAWASLDQRRKALEAKQSGLLEFAKAVLGADPNEDFIRVSTLASPDVPDHLSKDIMVRACYRRIVDLILKTDSERSGGSRKRRFAMVITGTPGIGKSTLALYLLCCLAHEHQKVVYRYSDQVDEDTLVLLDFTDHSDIKVDRASEGAGDWSRLRAVAKDPSTWLLIDGSAPQAQFSGGPRIIVMTPPDPSNYSEFKKGSLEELEECRAELYPLVHPDAVKERFTQFGGVVRFVLEQPDYPFEELLGGLTKESAHHLVNLDIERARSAVRHCLAHAEVTEDFKFRHYALGPPKILDAVTVMAEYSGRKYMDDLMKAGAARHGSSGMASFLGSMHEHYVHHLVPRGWRLDPSTFRRLQPKKAQAPAIEPPRFTAQQLSDALAQKQRRAWDDGQDLAMTEGYFQPWSCSHAGYDAFIISKDFTIILQITRDPNHQVNAEGIMSLLKRLPSGRPACALFTLAPHPPALSRQFKYQSWTMEECVGTSPATKRGKQAERKVFKRLEAEAEKLPALVKEVEQWCVPFPVT